MTYHSLVHLIVSAFYPHHVLVGEIVMTGAIILLCIAFGNVLDGLIEAMRPYRRGR
jgi:hypothetical protein